MNISIKAVSNVVELKPEHKYLLVFKGAIPEDVHQVLQMIRAVGIVCVGVGLDDGESVQIVEVPSEQ